MKDETLVSLTPKGRAFAIFSRFRDYGDFEKALEQLRKEDSDTQREFEFLAVAYAKSHPVGSLDEDLLGYLRYKGLVTF